MAIEVRTPRSKFQLKLLATLVFWVVVLGFGWHFRQTAIDWWKLRGYTPPAAVVSLAGDDTLTNYSRHVLYVNRPQVETKTAFTQCNNTDEQTIVLGCYHGSQSGIFVLAVTDPRLKGVEQVTLAHEMLHAAYERLSLAERTRVNNLLENYYQSGLTDQRIKDTINEYRRTEPTAVVDEMHSVFGTEVTSLPAPLEQYYRQYFTNRAAITSMAASYEAEFTSRQAQVKQDDAQLTAWKQQIDSLNADLKTQQGQLTSDAARLQSLKSGGDVAAYNAAVPGYNAAIDSYNQEIGQLKAVIQQYNDLVARRNAIVLEAKQLTDEINSRVAPIAH